MNIGKKNGKGEIAVLEPRCGYNKEYAKLIREHGFSPILVTSDKKYPTEDLASYDEILVANPKDGRALLSALKTRPHLKGIIPNLCPELYASAEVTEALQLGGPDPKGLKRNQYKDLVRLLVEDLRIPQPQFYVAIEESFPKESPVGYPCVVKPVCSYFCDGAFICKNEEEYEKARQSSLERRTFQEGQIIERRWLIEEYIGGTLYGAIATWSNGEWVIPAFVEYDTSLKGGILIDAATIPANLPSQADEDEIKEVFIKILNSIQLKKGVVELEFKVKDGVPMLIEINGRLPFTRIGDLMSLYSNSSIYDFVLRSVLEENPIFICNPSKEKKYFTEYFIFPKRNGVIESIEFPTVCPGVREYVQTVMLPKTVEEASSGVDTLGLILTEGNTLEETLFLAQKVEENIVIHYRAE